MNLPHLLPALKRIVRLARAITLLVLCALLPAGCQPQTPEDKLEQAANYYRQKAFWDSIAILERVLEQTPPGDPALREAKFMLGNCWLRINDVARAREVFTEFIALYGIDHEQGMAAFRNLVYAYYFDASQTQDEAEQDQLMLKALSFVREHEDDVTSGSLNFYQLLFTEADVLAKLNRLDDSLERLVRTAAENPDNPALRREAIQLADQLLSQYKEHQRAIEFHQQFLAQDPESPLAANLLLLICRHYQELGDAQQAEEYLERSFAIYDREIENTMGAENRILIASQKADALRLLQRPEQAAAIYRQLLADFPESARVIWLKQRIAETYAFAGMLDPALEAYTRIMQEHPRSREAAQVDRIVQQLQLQKLSLERQPAAAPAPADASGTSDSLSLPSAPNNSGAAPVINTNAAPATDTAASDSRP